MQNKNVEIMMHSNFMIYKDENKWNGTAQSNVYANILLFSIVCERNKLNMNRKITLTKLSFTGFFVDVI